MRPIEFAGRKLRGLHRRFREIPQNAFPYEEYVDVRDQEANDLLLSRMVDDKPLMVAKFGTVEMDGLLNYLSIQEQFTLASFLDYVTRRRKYLKWWECLGYMHRLAGVFPGTPEIGVRFGEEFVRCIPEIDILGSYFFEECHVASLLGAAKRVNLDGYCAPYIYKNPWTKSLAGRRVLVVHPFEDSIRSQYEKRRLLFSDPDVLPDFTLETVKAVQSVAGENPGFPDWTAALQSMKDQMDALDYDVALVGCGSYGLPLVAHAKKRGKKGIHLAGWTQMLFGIYGERWKSDPLVNSKVRGLINDHWVRPSQTETPKHFKKIENGCYW